MPHRCRSIEIPSSPRTRLGLAVSIMVAAALFGCSRESSNKTEPLPAVCDELAATLTRCFSSAEVGDTARKGFPVVKKGDEAALAHLEIECRRNLQDLKGDCR